METALTLDETIGRLHRPKRWRLGTQAERPGLDRIATAAGVTTSALVRQMAAEGLATVVPMGERRVLHPQRGLSGSTMVPLIRIDASAATAASPEKSASKSISPVKEKLATCCMASALHDATAPASLSVPSGGQSGESGLATVLSTSGLRLGAGAGGGTAVAGRGGSGVSGAPGSPLQATRLAVASTVAAST